jgi:phosphoglycolate phosphatase
MNRNKVKKIFLFDFDGPIIDTTDICFGISCKNKPDLTRAEYKEAFMGNIHSSKLHLDHQIVKYDFHTEYYKALPEMKAVEGVREVLAGLVADGAILSIVSSSETKAIVDWLTMNGMREYFDQILGRDVETSKVKKFLMLAEHYQTEPKDMTFVTDTVGDVREARELGMPTVAVTWGYHDKELLQSAQEIKDEIEHPIIIDRIDELKPAFDRIARK